MANDIALLAGLLASANATPRISPERIASSTIYDLEYRTSITAAAFVTLAQPERRDAGRRRVRFAELKLGQFVAMRPWLLPILWEWKRAQVDPQQSLLTSERLRRGFLGDSMFDDTIDYLSAKSVIRRVEQFVVADIGVGYLDDINRSITDAALFARERATLSSFVEIAITASMLEGW